MGHFDVFVTVFQNAAKTEVQQFGRREIIGWFRDEVSAIGAACERVLMQSAILPELRKLKEVSVHCEYRREATEHSVSKFVRATKVKRGTSGRRVVMTSGAFRKPWMMTVTFFPLTLSGIMC